MVFSFEIKFNTVVKTKARFDGGQNKNKNKASETKVHTNICLCSIYNALQSFCPTSIFKIFSILIIQLELVYLSKFVCQIFYFKRKPTTKEQLSNQTIHVNKPPELTQRFLFSIALPFILCINRDTQICTSKNSFKKLYKQTIVFYIHQESLLYQVTKLLIIMNNLSYGSLDVRVKEINYMEINFFLHGLS